MQSLFLSAVFHASTRSRSMATLPLNFLSSAPSSSPVPPLPPLLLLHGLLGSASTYRALLKRPDFAPHRQKIALDLRNHGLSPHVATPDAMSYANMAKDIVSFLDSRSLPHACIVGHSMGGKAAMQLALTVPHRVSQLIVVDIAPITYIPTPHPADPSIVLRAMRNVDFSVAKSRKDVDTHLLEGGLSSEQVRHFVMTNLVKSDTVDQRYRWKLNLPAISDSYRQIASFPNHEGNVYNGPTCMIRGGKSSYVPFHAMKNFTALFPNTKLVTISEAGHWLQSQNPDDFVRSVNDFLSD